MHPKPALNRLIQFGAAGVSVLLIVAAFLQTLLSVLIGEGGAFFLSAILTLLLMLPVLMLTANAPAVTVSEGGLTLHPAVWKEHHIQWEAIQAVKVYPLLPSEDSEVTRRIAIGRKKYVPAAGIMLTIPKLPPQYRIAGFLAGERAVPIIALTNRAHTDYEQLVRAVLERTDPAIHDLE